MKHFVKILHSHPQNHCTYWLVNCSTML